jgi:hypothetical protein
VVSGDGEDAVVWDVVSIARRVELGHRALRQVVAMS